MIASTMMALAAMGGAGDLEVEFWDPGAYDYVYLADSNTSDWVVASDIAYTLVLYDARDRSNPRFVDAIPFHAASDVAIWGDTCYVSASYPAWDVHIFEMSAELGFVPLGMLERSGHSLGVEEGLLFVQYSDVFDIYDRRAPGGPVLLSSTPVEGGEFVWDEDHVYFDDRFEARILDVSDPFQPRIVGEIDRFPSRVRSLAVERDAMLLAVGTNEESGPQNLEIWDIAAPADPVVLSSIDLISGEPRNVVIEDTLLVVGTGSTQIYSIVEPAIPRLLSEIGPSPGIAKSLLLADDVLWVSEGSPGITAYDITTPSAPESLWTWDRIGIVRSSAVTDTLVVTIHDRQPPGEHPHLKIHGISDLRRNHAISRVDFPHEIYLGMVAAAGRMAYVAPELWCVDLADPAHPVVTDSLTPADTINVTTELIAPVPGGLVTVTNLFDLYTYRTDDPLHPVLAGQLDLEYAIWAWDLETAELHGRREAILGSSAGVFRIDVSDLDNPSVISILGRSGESVAIDDTIAFIGYWGKIEARKLEADGGFTLLESILTEGGPYTHALMTRNGRLYASHRTLVESYFTSYTWSRSGGFRVEDRVPIAGYVTNGNGGPIGLPNQRILVPAISGLHLIWDRGVFHPRPVPGRWPEFPGPADWQRQ